jgi:hypothetical protein
MSDVHFRPVEGALVDLTSLAAIPAALQGMLGTWLRATSPGSTGLVLEGLDLEGEWAPSGPPGTRRPDARAASVVVTAGTALVHSREGAPYLVRLPEDTPVAWPTAAGVAVRGVLALTPKIEPGRIDGGLLVANEYVTAELGVVRPDQAEQQFLLPVAVALGNGRDWAVDIARLMQPEDPAVRYLLLRFDQIESTVWKAEPEGSVWQRQVHGRNWVRYQTIASSAVQMARMTLCTQALNTVQRVRLLTSLHDQLANTVERAATDLLQIVGTEGVGPWKGLGQRRAEGG